MFGFSSFSQVPYSTLSGITREGVASIDGIAILTAIGYRLGEEWSDSVTGSEVWSTSSTSSDVWTDSAVGSDIWYRKG